MSGTVEAHGLIKTYGDVRALDGLDLVVPEGSILGLLMAMPGSFRTLG